MDDLQKQALISILLDRMEDSVKIIELRRGYGKTTQIIKQSAGRNVVIVCFNRQECERVFRQAAEMNIPITMPISFVAFMEGGLRGRKIDAVLIDNIDLCLQSLSPIEIETITMTKE